MVNFCKVKSFLNNDSGKGIFIAIALGSLGFAVRKLSGQPLMDPLILSLLLGIIAGSLLTEQQKFRQGFLSAPALLIPVGIIFYGLSNLNFAKAREIDFKILLLLITSMIVYFLVIILMGRRLRQRKEITYLTAAGSAICGASAVAVTSPAVNAEPEDISISIFSVMLAGSVGFGLILPFLSALLQLSCRDYCYLSGATLQFTGLVKVATQFAPFLNHSMSPSEMLTTGMSLKAVRYLGLLVAVPLFASLIKKRLYFPWYLWAFVAAGILGTWIYTSRPILFSSSLTPLIKPVHTLSWSIAMAAIGLNTHVRDLITRRGALAIIMALSGFLAATLTFFTGILIFNNW